MDRAISTFLFLIALLCLGGAALLLLNEFIEYLQHGRWHTESLLKLGYDSSLVKAGWFLRHDWSWWIHDVLAAVPTWMALIGIGPLAWWFSNRLGNR